MWRLTFHICPHASQRQYVEALTFSFGIEMFADRQNGQTVGGGSSSGSAGFTRSSPVHGTPSWAVRMSPTAHPAVSRHGAALTGGVPASPVLHTSCRIVQFGTAGVVFSHLS